MKIIVLIENTPALADIYHEVLSLHQYDVLQLDGPLFTMFTAIGQLQPGVVILDVQLGAQDGRDLCRLIKWDATTRHIPIILMTDDPYLAMNSKQSGADALLYKPFPLEELVLMVAA